MRALLLLVLASCAAAPGYFDDDVIVVTGTGKADGTIPTSVHLALGVPTDATPEDDILLVRSQMAISYNRFLNGPNWVSWRTIASDYGDVPRYRGNFFSDRGLPDGVFRPSNDDYIRWDRGHMLRSEERTDTVENNRATFVLSNILPQSADLNRGPWFKLELYVEASVKAGKEAYMIAGPIWPTECDPHDVRTAGDGCADTGRSDDPTQRIAIPAATFKIVVFVEPGAPATSPDRQVTAVVMPNISGIMREGWEQYTTTVDAIEQATGYHFLAP